MPRPKPPEELFPATYRLTRTQIRKINSMGGVAALRELITKARAAPLTKAAAIKARDADIASSKQTTAELAEKHKLNPTRVRQIRSAYAK